MMNITNSTSNPLYPYPDSTETAARSEDSTFGACLAGTVEEFMERVRNSRTPPEKLLYNGSAERTAMTGEQVAELARKYDPTNMTQDEYRDFLDELQDMGVISEMEKVLMDYDKGCQLLGYTDAEGDYVWTDTSAYVHLGEEGNLRKTLEELNRRGVSQGVCVCGKESHHTEQYRREQKKSREQAERRLSLLTGIVNNMMEYRRIHGIPSGKQQTEAADENASLLEQAKDPGGEFWLNMRNFIFDNARKKREQDKEEAELEMLDTILESMTGSEESRRKAMQKMRMAVLQSTLQNEVSEDERR